MAERKLRIVCRLIIVSAAFGACATAAPVEDSRRMTAQFQGQTFTPAPRTVTDLIRTLDAISPDPARVARDHALADGDPRAGGRPAVLADFYYRRAMAAGRVAREEQRLDDLRRAARLGEDARLSFQVLREIFRDLAFAEVTAGNFNAAIEALRRAMAIQPSPSVASSEMATRLYALVGDLESAREFAGRIREPRDRSDPPARWRIAMASAWVLHGEGRWREAEAAIREALHRMDAPAFGEPPARAWHRIDVTRVLAENLLEQRRLAEAEVVAREALRRSLESNGKAHPTTARLIGLVGAILAAQGRLDDAERLARLGLSTLEGLRLPLASLTLARSHQTLGGILVAQRKWTEAAATFGRARASMGSAPEFYERVYGRRLDEPLALAFTGRARDAVQQLVAGLAYRRQNLTADHPDTVETQAVLAVARKRAGDVEGALSDFAAAVPALLEGPSGRDTRDGGSREWRVQIVVEEYIDLLSRIRGPEAAFEMLRLAEATRGRRVQQALAAAATRAAARDPKLAELVRREQDARNRLAVLDGHLAQLASAPAGQQPSAIIRQARAEAEQLRKSLVALERDIGRGFPDYALLMNPRPPALPELQRRLQPEEALVVLHVGAERTLVWGVPSRGPVAFAAINLPAARLTEWVVELRRALDANPRTLGDIPPFDTSLAYRLYATLLQPVASAWREAKSFVVVPDGPLAQLPLGLLVTAPHVLGPERDGGPLFAPYRSVPWLARRAAVTQLPSVASFVALRALPPAAAARRPFAGFADPWFSGPRAESAVAAQARPATPDATASQVAARGLAFTRRGSPETRTADSAALARLPALPETADEVRQIAGILGADPERDVFLGRQANEQVVRVTNLSDRRVIMFATHGLVPGDLDGLTEPALALTAPEVAGVPGDGLLTMGEIVGLRLDADWVVLSACNTAAGEGAGAEAVSGLGRAFFYAGARALLVSNWPVETTSAAALTTDLFRRQAGGSALSRAEALRQAMLGLIDGPGFVRRGRAVFSYAHPIFWAPFSVVGD